MATTAIFAEILIIGFQAGVWLALLVASIFGTENVPIQDLKEWQYLLIFPVVAIAYVLGILLDRVADTAFLKIRRVAKRGEDETLPADFGTMRLRILMQNDAVAKFMDYQRSRLRITRATALNLLLIIITGIAFLFTRTDFSALQISMFALVGVVLLALSLYAVFRIDTAQTETLAKAYQIITAGERQASGLVAESPARAAAICYRRGGRGIEFLLVRTSDGLRWTFPKGNVEAGESPEEAAAREAKEEAGVIGKVRPEPVVEYSFPLQGSGPGIEKKQVVAFLLEVTAEIDSQERARDPTWFEPQEAKKKLAECREREFVVEHERAVDTAVEELGRSLD